jgi:hypothetical protein
MNPDADPDPVIFVRDLQGVQKKFFFATFFSLGLFEGTSTYFSKIKIHKEDTKQ